MRFIILFVIFSLTLELLENENGKNLEKVTNHDINQDDFYGQRRRHFRGAQLKNEKDSENSGILGKTEGKGQFRRHRRNYEKVRDNNKNWERPDWSDSSEANKDIKRKRGRDPRMRKGRNPYDRFKHGQLTREEFIRRWQLFRERFENKEGGFIYDQEGDKRERIVK